MDQHGIARQAIHASYKPASTFSLYDVLVSLPDPAFLKAMAAPRCDNKRRLRRLRARRARLRDFARATLVVHPGPARAALAAAHADFARTRVARRLDRMAPPQPALVRLLVEALVARHAYLPAALCASHVLAAGFKPDTDGGVGATYTAAHINTTAAHVAAHPSWLALRAAAAPSTVFFLLAHCSVFCAPPGSASSHTLLQVAGPSFHAVVEGSPLLLPKPPPDKERNLADANSARILFKKTKILYKNPYVVNKKIIFGFNPHFILKKYSRDSPASLHLVLRSIFPVQFRIPCPLSTPLNFPLAPRAPDPPPSKARLPKRLHGQILPLIGQLALNVNKCPYYQLLNHYCPNAYEEASSKIINQFGCKNAWTLTPAGKRAYWGLMKSQNLSTPDYQVFLFCKSVFRKTFPVDLIGKSNWGPLLNALDQFIKLRRLEQIQLQSIVQGMSTNNLSWTWPGSTDTPPPGRQDHNKRRELLLELVFWIFDTFLPTLLRGHFYATQVLQSAPGNRVLYFRHDVWAQVSTLAFTEFSKLSFLSPLSSPQQITSPLGAAPIRIIPKEQILSPSTVAIAGYRPIVCMSRVRRTYTPTGPLETPSINTLLKDVFSALSFEHSQKIKARGFHNVATTSSVPELFQRILHFKQQIGTPSPKLFVVKVDIKSCFDTIPQSLALDMASRLLRNDSFKEYFFHAFKVFKVPLPAPSKRKNKPQPAVMVKYLRNAEYTTSTSTSMDVVEQLAKDEATALQQSAVHGPGTLANKTANIVVDLVYGARQSGQQLASLLRAHLTENLVYLEGGRNKQLYKQQVGIPQGSVLSTLLCNLVYEELETEILAEVFDTPSQSSPHMLARFTDDFLFISTNQAHAEAFLNKMIAGVPKYGATVRPEKTIINFVPSVMTTDTARCKVLAPGEILPYIGIGLNLQNLNIFRDSDHVPSFTDASHGVESTPGALPRARSSVYLGVPDRVTLPHRGIRSSPVLLKRMLLRFISMRLLRAFVDLRVNSRGTVSQNVSTVVTEVARRLVFALDMQWGFPRSAQQTRNAATMMNILAEVLDKVCSIITHVNGPQVFDNRDKPLDLLKSAADDIAVVLRKANKGKRCGASKEVLRLGVEYLNSL